MNRKTFLQAILVAAMGACAPLAQAQAWPARPITVVVPFPAGGPADVVGRLIGDSLRASLGQPVVFENTPGASGSIGTAKAVRAAPDGYTFVIGYWGSHVANQVIYPLNYDVVKDFEPVVRLPGQPLFVVTRGDLPANNLKDFVAWLKANPGKASQGTAGVGSAGHMMGVLFQQRTGTQYQFIPYKGTPPATQAALSGEVDFIFNNPTTTIPHVRAGKLKALAVLAPQRLAIAPEVPTSDELGMPGLDFSIWLGLWAPKGTPKAIVDKMNAAVIHALAEPKVREQLDANGFDRQAPADLTPAALGALQKREIDRWWPLIKAANVKPE